MKNVLLIPTDFSENAWVATKYAIQLASKFGWDVHLLHVYQTMRRSMAGIEFNDAIESNAADKAERAMVRLVDKIKQKSNNLNSISTACLAGNLSHVIVDLVKDDQVKLIVMGTKGASGVKHATLGSNTFEIIQKSPIGVLAVPETYTCFRFEKIGLLANFKDSEVRLLQEFATRISAAVDVVMLHIEEAHRKKDKDAISFWVNHVLTCSQVLSVSYRSGETIKRLDFSTSLPFEIIKLIQDDNVDLLLVSYNRKSFFRIMFSKSLSKELAHNLVVPTYFKRDDT